MGTTRTVVASTLALIASHALAAGVSDGARSAASGAPVAQAAPGQAAGPLTNGDIVNLVKLGLADDVIVAKIRQAPRVAFDLEPDDLVKLKNDGASSAVVAAMLGRATAAPSSASSAGQVAARLVTADGELELSATRGSIRSIVAPFVGFHRYVGFSGQHATVRTTDRRPSAQIESAESPVNRWWLVRLDVDEDDDERGLDLRSPGMWGGEMSEEPEAEDVVPTDATDEGGGWWRLTPRKELSPGEYGVHGPGVVLHDFGVDKGAKKPTADGAPASEPRKKRGR